MIAPTRSVIRYRGSVQSVFLIDSPEKMDDIIPPAKEVITPLTIARAYWFSLKHRARSTPIVINCASPIESVITINSLLNLFTYEKHEYSSAEPTAIITSGRQEIDSTEGWVCNIAISRVKPPPKAHRKADSIRLMEL